MFQSLNVLMFQCFNVSMLSFQRLFASFIPRVWFSIFMPKLDQPLINIENLSPYTPHISMFKLADNLNRAGASQ